MCVSKNREFLQNFKNRADFNRELKLPKRESPAGIGRVGMFENDVKLLKIKRNSL